MTLWIKDLGKSAVVQNEGLRKREQKDRGKNVQKIFVSLQRGKVSNFPVL